MTFGRPVIAWMTSRANAIAGETGKIKSPLYFIAKPQPVSLLAR